MVDPLTRGPFERIVQLHLHHAQGVRFQLCEDAHADRGYPSKLSKTGDEEKQQKLPPPTD